MPQFAKKAKAESSASRVLGPRDLHSNPEWMVTALKSFWLPAARTHMLSLGLTLVFACIWQLAFSAEPIGVLSFRCLLVLCLRARQEHSGCSACAPTFCPQPLKLVCTQCVLFLLSPVHWCQESRKENSMLDAGKTREEAGKDDDKSIFCEVESRGTGELFCTGHVGLIVNLYNWGASYQTKSSASSASCASSPCAVTR